MIIPIFMQVAAAKRKLIMESASHFKQGKDFNHWDQLTHSNPPELYLEYFLGLLFIPSEPLVTDFLSATN